MEELEKEREAVTLDDLLVVMYCVFSIQYYLFQYLFEHLCYVHVHVNWHVYVCTYSKISIYQVGVE